MPRNYAYILCALLATTVLLNDVNAKSHGHSHHSSSHHASHHKPTYHKAISKSDTSDSHSGFSGSGHSSGSFGNINPPAKRSYSSHSTSGVSHLNSVHKPASYPAGSSSGKISYPASSGLSGTGSSYPASNGLSGGGKNTGSSYPASIGLSGSGSRNTGSSYPTSNGLSGSGSRNTGTSYPTSNGLSGGGKNTGSSYPASIGLSGSGSRNTGSSYPISNGLSGSGSRNTGTSYPTSNGLSGGGSRNTGTSYPVSNGLSGGGSQTGSSYPASNGLSGSGSRNTGTSYPTSNSGLSSSGSIKPGISPKPASYPSSNGGLFVNKPIITNYPTNKPTYTYPPSNNHNNYWEVRHEPQQVHHFHRQHYVYRPPTVIHYTTSYGSPVNYPVYTGEYLPPYVYEYRSSENKYRQLLAGLALYNLGKVSNSPTKQRYHQTYVPRPDEICMFGAKDTNGYEEMGIDCRVITNFLWEEESKPKATSTFVNQTTITTNVVHNTVMLPNGTLVPAGQVVNQNVVTSFVPNDVMLPNGTLVPAAVAKTLRTEGMPPAQVLLPNGTLVSHVSDPKFYGKPVDIHSNMECYVIRTTRSSEMRKSVPCGLLQTYAVQSLRKNSAVACKSSLALLLMAVGLILF